MFTRGYQQGLFEVQNEIVWELVILALKRGASGFYKRGAWLPAAAWTTLSFCWQGVIPLCGDNEPVDVVQQHKPPHVDENHRSVAARVGYRDTDVRGASTESGR